jgi:hypothetical protein
MTIRELEREERERGREKHFKKIKNEFETKLNKCLKKITFRRPRGRRRSPLDIVVNRYSLSLSLSLSYLVTMSGWSV